ncbi:Phosphate-binding protein PstS precursor [Luteitalea pratensis]|uniref:Phosphate-binding protein n=1 Tax=Luteitalea pratensis TaxID=1855912 RepID=A0A143PIU7_LUTPR|nr:phosphate ABC transporter substrate-binding protein [Luteitalea pratensis]AMY08431.1 Phosphate-binding protein PstS precursor [Luteitalea pratensis]
MASLLARRLQAAGALALAALGTASCQRSTASERTVLLNRGSDTMINVAQAWAEEYAKVAPGVSVEVAGGGSGVGIAALIDGTVQIANSSRPMKPAEQEATRTARGADPVEHVTGYDALVVYVHAKNPVQSMTLEQLRDLFAEGGRISRWSDFGVRHDACPRDTIIRISRQSSSGTYDFFREAALDKHDFKLGTLELNGSKEVVELVAHTPCAIGYSGMGYATPGVKMLSLSREGGPPVAPTVQATLDRSYPIARPLYMYTVGQPEGETKRYLDWIHSPPGQRIVSAVGYVPLPASETGPVPAPPSPSEVHP